MEVEILETRDFPSSELNRAGRMETHVFVRINGVDVTSVNLGRQVADPNTIKSLLVDALKARQSLAGQKITI